MCKCQFCWEGKQCEIQREDEQCTTSTAGDGPGASVNNSTTIIEGSESSGNSPPDGPASEDPTSIEVPLPEETTSEGGTASATTNPPSPSPSASPADNDDASVLFEDESSGNRIFISWQLLLLLIPTVGLAV